MSTHPPRDKGKPEEEEELRHEDTRRRLWLKGTDKGVVPRANK